MDKVYSLGVFALVLFLIRYVDEFPESMRVVLAFCCVISVYFGLLVMRRP